ncbi:MAG: DUF6982 domain-containing protein [Phycisphaerales bacterium JB038]
MARFKDGRVLKGTSLDIDPNKPTFHVRAPGAAAEQVRLEDLKALFFVRSLEGDPQRDDATEADPGDPRLRGSTLVELTFADGERIVGMTNRYPPNRAYFYVVPVDAASNNVRILINRAAVTEHRPLL